MNLKATKNYFIIKIAKDKQHERKDKIGSIVIPAQYVFMTRNMQCGTVVSIGQKAGARFPELKEGHVLICHHFIEDADFFVHSDGECNYYAVWGIKETGMPNRAYGLFDGETIMPHEDYIFLNKPEKPKSDLVLTSGGLWVSESWKMTRQQKIDKMADLKKRNETLSHSGTNKRHVIEKIQENEIEMEGISKTLNKDYVALYDVAYANPAVGQWFNLPPESIKRLYMQTLGCQTEVEFMNTTYIMADSKFIAGCPQ